MSIEVKNISYTYGEYPVLSDVSFSIGSGELVAVLGPNGVGKSTLFRCVLGFLKPQSGGIFVDGRPMSEMTRMETARKIAYIPQTMSPVFNYTVRDMVLMGMTNRMGMFQSPSSQQKKRAGEILDALGIGHLSSRGVGRVSGGERQLTLLGRALAQNAEVLVMDEPTANLDYGNQYRVMERIEALTRDKYTVILSTHDPNTALQHATRVLGLKAGRLICDGAPGDVLTEGTLSGLYGIGVAKRVIEVDGRKLTVTVPA